MRAGRCTSAETKYVPCPLCGSQETRTRWVTRDYRLGTGCTYVWVRCQDCGLTYLNPRLLSTRIQRHYVSGMYGKNPAWGGKGLGRRLRRMAKHQVLRTTKAYPGDVRLISGCVGRLAARWVEHIPPWVPDGRLLDLGTGSGHYARSMAELGWATVSLDLNFALLADVHGLRGVDVAAGRAERLPFRAASFDVVVMRHVIEHLATPVNALREVYDVLKAGGLLRIETPNVDSLQARWFRAKWFHLDAPRHLVLFNADTLSAALGKAGFTILQLRTMPSSVGLVGSLQIALGLSGWQNAGVRLRQSWAVRGLAWPVEMGGTIFHRGSCLGVWAVREV